MPCPPTAGSAPAAISVADAFGSSSGKEAVDERLLLRRLNGLVAVLRSHPVDGPIRFNSRQNGHTGESPTGSAMRTETTHFHPLTFARASQ